VNGGDLDTQDLVADTTLEDASDDLVEQPRRWVDPPIGMGERLGVLTDVGCGTPELASTA
jgi:hypothetical protein